MKRLCSVFALAAVCSACGSSTAPTPTPVPSTPTKIIGISGTLAFGNVNLGTTADRQVTVSNTGNTVLTFTSVSCAGGTGTVGYAVSPTSGTIQPQQNIVMTVHFAPTLGQFYSCVMTINADQTAGGAAINVSGTGVNPNPIFTASGNGNNVFTLPSYVTKLHIVGTYTGNSSNFIVYVGSSLIVNDLVGRDWASTVSDGVYLVPAGGQVQVTNSTGVAWTFTEVR